MWCYARCMQCGHTAHAPEGSSLLEWCPNDGLRLTTLPGTVGNAEVLEAMYQGAADLRDRLQHAYAEIAVINADYDQVREYLCRAFGIDRSTVDQPPTITLAMEAAARLGDSTDELVQFARACNFDPTSEGEFDRWRKANAPQPA